MFCSYCFGKCSINSILVVTPLDRLMYNQLHIFVYVFLNIPIHLPLDILLDFLLDILVKVFLDIFEDVPLDILIYVPLFIFQDALLDFLYYRLFDIVKVYMSLFLTPLATQVGSKLLASLCELLVSGIYFIQIGCFTDKRNILNIKINSSVICLMDKYIDRNMMILLPNLSVIRHLICGNK